MRPRPAARPPGFVLGLAGVLTLAGAARAADQPSAAPLPDARTFISQVRERLHTDEFLLDQYTFTEKHTETNLDEKGGIRKITTATYEVYPSPEPGRTYRKLVEQDGKPLTASKLDKENRRQQEKEWREAQIVPEEEKKRARALAERQRTETEVIEDLFRVYDLQIVRREQLDGRSAILLTFHPRAGVEPATKAGKILKKFAGRAWIDEDDRQLVRVEGELVDDLSFGFGILAKLRKGATASMLRRKVNNEIWLPAEARFVGHARVLLVKGLHIDSLSQYSDYRKFTVATETAITPELEAK
jgi:hypothetical protein